MFEFEVAPHAGAWIETLTSRVSPFTANVAPHAGAWIETTKDTVYDALTDGRPSRRGVD